MRLALGAGVGSDDHAEELAQPEHRQDPLGDRRAAVGAHAELHAEPALLRQQRAHAGMQARAAQEFVLREEDSTTRRVFGQGIEQARVQVRVALEMGSREAVREAVAQGIGLAVVADTGVVDELRTALAG